MCPVDRILSRFWGFVSSVARSGQGLKKQGEDELLIVSILKDEDDLCVASQLPCRFRFHGRGVVADNAFFERLGDNFRNYCDLNMLLLPQSAWRCASYLHLLW